MCFLLNKLNFTIQNKSILRKFCKSILICSLFFANFFGFTQNIYPSNQLGTQKLNLTEEEKQFLKDNQFFKVVSLQDYAPFEFNISGKSRYKKYAGYNVSILEKVGEILGVEFIFLPTNSMDESISKFVKQEANIITGYTSLIEDQLHTYGINHGKIGTKIKYSEPIYNVPYFLLGKTGNLPSAGDTIATVNFKGQEYDDFANLITKNSDPNNPIDLKEFKIKKYKTGLQIIKAFNKKSIDYAILNATDYNFFENTSKTNYYRLDKSIAYSHRFIFSESTPEIAVRIFNKAYNSIDKDEFTELIEKTTIERKNFIDNYYYRGRFKLVLIICLILIAVLIVFAIFHYKRRSSHKLTETVETDELTGLISFKMFRHTARQYIKKAGKNQYYLLSLDMNHFNYINDSYGNNKGNAMLIELANLFTNSLKEDELVTRFYADNFIFLLKNPGTLPGIKSRINQLTNIDEIIEKLLPKGYDVSFSAGIYYVDKTINSSEEITSMVDKANLARKASKEDTNSKTTVAEFTQEMDDKVELKKEITLSMENALKDNEFEVYYQPKVQVSDEKIIGAEALIRWNRKKGLLKPDQFVNEFEKNGFIKKIDYFVLREVCKFLHAWKSVPGTYPITISFNLSRIHLKDPKLVQSLTEIKNQYDIFPNKIEVELTERVMYDNPERVVETMQDIKNAGYSISVDDFGAGYSSLNLLKDMPADVLKIDKEFFSAKKNQKENIIVSSVINMSKDLNLKTVAEGVETKDQADFLKEAGCDYIQGFYYFRPIREPEFLARLQESTKK